jgi:hypothetical protein
MAPVEDGEIAPAAITLVPVATTLMGRTLAPMMPILGSHEQRRKAAKCATFLPVDGQKYRSAALGTVYPDRKPRIWEPTRGGRRVTDQEHRAGARDRRQ